MLDSIADALKSFYEIGYNVWNHLISIAVTLFTTSPTAAAGGSLYSTAHGLFLSITSISLPIAIVFFLLALIQDVMNSPADQQFRQFIKDFVKFGVMVGILANLWTIMGYVMQIADGVTNAFSSSTPSYNLSLSSELSTIITEVTTAPVYEGDVWQYVCDFLSVLVGILFFFISGAITLVTIIAAAISIINSAFQRIIKPLVILPFSAITVALASGTHEAGRTTAQYLKTFFGFCISGAFMIVAIKLGVNLSNGLISLSLGSSIFEKALLISIQTAITPILIAGLVKSADSTIARFL